jgi:hypothetical protein
MYNNGTDLTALGFKTFFYFSIFDLFFNTEFHIYVGIDLHNRNVKRILIPPPPPQQTERQADLIRVRIRGSVPYSTDPDWLRIRILPFPSLAFKMPKKLFFLLKVFLLITYHASANKVIKKSQNRRCTDFSTFFLAY